MATFAINPTGLKVKPTYESMTNYIANQPMIAYPDRTATRIARSQKMASCSTKTRQKWHSNKQRLSKTK